MRRWSRVHWVSKLSFLSAASWMAQGCFFVLACETIRIGSSKGSPTETLETIAMSTDWVRFLVRKDSEWWWLLWLCERACTTCLQRADMFMSYKRMGKIARTVEVLDPACSCLINYYIINWCFGKRNPMNLSEAPKLWRRFFQETSGDYGLISPHCWSEP